MSFNVLVVGENPTYNGSILKPLCRKLLAECGKPRAYVEIMSNPAANGYAHAKSLFPNAILDLHHRKHLVLFLPDSDMEERAAEFKNLEEEFAEEAESRGSAIRLICCAAEPEVEAWLLAGHEAKWQSNWRWNAMRSERSFKEIYFQPFLQAQAVDKMQMPDEGRKSLMILALQNYPGIRSRCPELQALEDRIRHHLSTLP